MYCNIGSKVWTQRVCNRLTTRCENSFLSLHAAARLLARPPCLYASVSPRRAGCGRLYRKRHCSRGVWPFKTIPGALSARGTSLPRAIDHWITASIFWGPPRSQPRCWTSQGPGISLAQDLAEWSGSIYAERRRVVTGGQKIRGFVGDLTETLG